MSKSTIFNSFCPMIVKEHAELFKSVGYPQTPESAGVVNLTYYKEKEDKELQEKTKIQSLATRQHDQYFLQKGYKIDYSDTLSYPNPYELLHFFSKYGFMFHPAWIENRYITIHFSHRDILNVEFTEYYPVVVEKGPTPKIEWVYEEPEIAVKPNFEDIYQAYLFCEIKAAEILLKQKHKFN